MNLNDDFSKPVLIHSADLAWQPSPMAGVERRMLDRIGGEVARATTIVRYAPDSHFSPHTHTGGEEFIVLDGVFQDEHGDFAAGSYVRNPPTSRHTPGSDAGCQIFVKLWQFDMADRHQITVEMGADLTVIAPGHQEQLLFEDSRERVSYHVLAAGADLSMGLPKGGELLMLQGTATHGGDPLASQSWLRLPMGAELALLAGAEGAKLWLKTGHLPYATAPRT